MNLFLKQFYIFTFLILSFTLVSCGGLGGTETGNPGFSENQDQPDQMTENPDVEDPSNFVDEESKIIYFDRNDLSDDIVADDPISLSDALPIDETTTCNLYPDLCLPRINLADQNDFQVIQSGKINISIYDELKIISNREEAMVLAFQLATQDISIDIDQIDFETHQLAFISEQLGTELNQIYFGAITQSRNQSRLIIIRKFLCNNREFDENYFFDLVLISKDFENITSITLDEVQNCN